MSRTQKLWLLGVPFVLAVLWIAAIGLQAFVAKGSMSAAPGAVSGEGWVQIVIAFIAAIEAGKGWVGALMSVAPAVREQLSTTVGDAKSATVGDLAGVTIDCSPLVHYKWLLSKVDDEQQRTFLIKGARAAADKLRDAEFPSSPGGV